MSDQATMSNLRIPVLLPLLFVLTLSGCASIPLPNMDGILGGQMPLTESTVADGLKEALRVGTDRTSSSLSAQGGFSDNTLLRIALPSNFETAASRLRSLGLDKQVDEFENQMNRAAEQAAAEAVDVFVTAIQGMTLQDAFAILDGPQDAATVYFKDRTTAELTSRFRPVVKTAMEKVGIYNTYNTLVKSYNSIPLVKPVTVDLEAHIVEKTLYGMFSVLADEEQLIRENPLARTTDLLKQVFGARR